MFLWLFLASLIPPGRNDWAAGVHFVSFLVSMVAVSAVTYLNEKLKLVFEGSNTFGWMIGGTVGIVYFGVFVICYWIARRSGWRVRDFDQ